MRQTAIAAFGCALLLLAMSQGAGAELGGQATNGDNCTPVNGFAIGFPVPGGGQIVDQRVLLADGWKTFGWALHDSKGTWWFAPLPTYGTTQPVNGQPPTTRLGRLDRAALVGAYEAFLAHFGPASVTERAPLDRILIAPCFEIAWPGPYLLKP
jgi:hypothetical protein